MATISFSSTQLGKKTPQSEASVQKECWAWLGSVFPGGGTGDSDVNALRARMLQDFSYMVPNGTQLGGSHKQRAMQMSNLKAQGFRTGVSDIVIAYPIWGSIAGHCHYPGAYIELKRSPESYGGPKALRARQTAIRTEQRAWLLQQIEVGYWGSVAWGFEDFKRLVGSYLRNESPPPLDWDERK